MRSEREGDPIAAALLRRVEVRVRGGDERRGARVVRRHDRAADGDGDARQELAVRVLDRRELHRRSQSLADALGLTFQQVQKYEGGSNRISASKRLPPTSRRSGLI